MKKIYIVLTYSGTLLSNIIKIYTKDEFSHISISLDKELKEMYSFGRIYSYHPFCAGFVHEQLERGFFKRFKNTRSAIYSMEISNESYKKIKKIISKMKKNKSKYKFNILGLFAVGLNKKITKENCFYCAEFVKHLLEISNVKLELPTLIRPENFKNIEVLELEYKGLLRNYNIESQ